MVGAVLAREVVVAAGACVVVVAGVADAGGGGAAEACALGASSWPEAEEAVNSIGAIVNACVGVGAALAEGAGCADGVLWSVRKPTYASTHTIVAAPIPTMKRTTGLFSSAGEGPTSFRAEIGGAGVARGLDGSGRTSDGTGGSSGGAAPIGGSEGGSGGGPLLPRGSSALVLVSSSGFDRGGSGKSSKSIWPTSSSIVPSCFSGFVTLQAVYRTAVRIWLPTDVIIRGAVPSSFSAALRSLRAMLRLEMKG